MKNSTKPDSKFEVVIYNKFFQLAFGIILFALADMRGGAGFLAWFVSVPFLLFVMENRGWKNGALLLGATMVGAHLSIVKIITPPVSVLMTPMFAVPTGVGLWFLLTIFAFFSRRLSSGPAMGAFVALVVILEWFQSFSSEMGVWGTLAHTQLHNLPLLQTASLTGMLGISALIAWVNVTIAMVMRHRSIMPFRRGIISALLVLSVLHVYGSVRLLQHVKGETIQAAAVSTDYIVQGGLPQPSDPVILKNNQAMLNRTREAARRGARLIVWNEGSTIVDRTGESDMIARIQSIAREYSSHVVAAYVVPVSEDFKSFENKYRWIAPDGSVKEEYFKHHPVPGEGSIRGNEPLRTVSTDFGTAAGAICYDYDFPHMSLEHARLGAGIVALPSSDWAGIDPRHTLMARVRAIEGGFSLLRSVRAATSMGFDAYGRIRGSLPYYEKNDRILMVTLPVERVETLYSNTGDLLPYGALAYLAFVAFMLIGKRQKEELP